MTEVISIEKLEEKKQQIEEDIKTHKVMLYMKGSKAFPTCGFSSKVVEVLQELEIPFETRDVLQDAILRQAIKEFSDWPTLPQLYINGQFIGGCDIVLELFERGELEKLLH